MEAHKIFLSVLSVLNYLNVPNKDVGFAEEIYYKLAAFSRNVTVSSRVVLLFLYCRSMCSRIFKISNLGLGFKLFSPILLRSVSVAV